MHYTTLKYNLQRQERQDCRTHWNTAAPSSRLAYRSCGAPNRVLYRLATVDGRRDDGYYDFDASTVLSIHTSSSRRTTNHANRLRL